MKVVNHVPIREINNNNNNKEVDFTANTLIIESHWNRSSLVVIRVNDDVSISVSADELKKAIENATNTWI
jgi:hypothetical protein